MPAAVDGFVDAEPAFGDDYLRRLARVFCLHLDGTERLSVLGPDGGQHRDSPLGVLVRSRRRREEVRRRAHAALGLYFCIEADPFQGVQARLSTEEVPLELEESFSEESQRFFARTIPFEEWSDGQRAYLGILAALIGSDYQVLTLDEPEMCLHPPLARQLGRDIADVMAARVGSAIVASHSPDFLMGCVQSGRAVSVARLSHTRGVSDARVLSSAELSPLMREPLLRSTGLLQCVFHKGVVVCEGDPDRAFYEEVNLRLFNSARPAVEDGVFLHSNGWQPMHRIVAPLRQLGIPTAAIVDLDSLGPGGDLVPLLKAAQLPSATIDGVVKTRDVLREGLTEDDLKRGLSAIAAQDAAREFVDQLAGYGVFLVVAGELERWLAHLGVGAKGGRWLVSMFERLESDPEAANYVKPTHGDVWQFLERIAGWISDPHRKGMPSSAKKN